MKFLLHIIFLVLLFSCSNNEDGNFEIVNNDSENVTKQIGSQLLAKDWLVGKWSDSKKNPRRQSHEIWWLNEEGNLEGKEFFVKLYYDTTKTSKHEIKLNDKNELTHFVNADGFTGNTTIPFKLTAQNKDSVKFENPAHKWPQTIVYKRITNDSMTITLDGYIHEANKTVMFEMTRYTKYGYEIK